ncbi:MAG: hypothetical protein EXR92_05825 [Gemmatimonadetes bacterium]|nr:hypothetical protein [Gemmatimonadota bacterium]
MRPALFFSGSRRGWPFAEPVGARGPWREAERVNTGVTKGVIRGLRWTVRIVLTVAVTWWIISRVGVSLEDGLSVRGALPDPSILGIALAVLVLLGGFLLGARLWGMMTAELGALDPGFVASSRIFLSANLGRYLPGKLWPVVGLAVLSRRIGISGTIAATAGVLGQTFSLTAAALLSLPILIQAGTLGRGAWVAVALLALGVIVATSVPRLLRGLLRAVFRAARMPSETVPRTRRLFGPRWTIWYLGNWGVYGAAFFLFMRSLGFEVEPSSVVPPFAAAYLLGYVAFFAPAGIGVREGFLIAFLRPELGGAAVGVAILARLWMSAVELLPAGGMAVWELFRERSRLEGGALGGTKVGRTREGGTGEGRVDARRGGG